MKKLLLFLLMVLLVTSCKKIMHEEQLSLSKIETKEELIDATNALYGLTTLITVPVLYQSLNGDDLSYYPPNYRYTIDKSCVYKNSHYYEYIRENNWNAEYTAIASANNIILQYKPGKKDKKIDMIVGEAYFFKAYLYWLLTQKYGRVPIIDDLIINYTNKLASFEELYSCIEYNLKKAMYLLPDNNASARIPYVTPCRGTAKAFLAELYLNWAGYPIKDTRKYYDAAIQARDLIDSASYFGYELLPDFADLWKKDHLYNNENIFSFYCNNYLIKNYNTSDLSKFYGEHMINLSAEVNFYNNYPAGYRKEITFKTSYTFYEENWDPILRKTVITDSTVVKIDKVDPCDRIEYRKFYYDTTVVHNYRYVSQYFVSDNPEVFGINRNYILRFAQTVLTYAEAMARSGQLNDKAYEAINMIRRRGRHLPLNEPSAYDLPKGLSPEAFADSVVWERAWELCAENNVRWNDLKRLELVEKLPEMQHPLEGGPPPRYDKSVYFEPIPSWEIRLNPHLRDK